MEQLSERLQTPISTAELERRWAAVRAAMERDKIDVLLIQNNNDHMGGDVKYFTDLPATNGYPFTVVFPRDDLMTLVSQGPFGGVNNLTAAGDGVRRGVKQWLTTPSFASCNYTAGYDAELAERRSRLMPAAPSALSAPTDVVRAGRLSAEGPLLQYALCRRLRSRRRHQGHQKRRGAGADQTRRGNAGRRDARRFRRRRAGHARPRYRGHRAVLQPASRQRKRHLSLRFDAGRTSRRSSASGIIRTASSRKATPSRSWSRIPVPAACTPNSAAPASSAKHPPRSRMNSPSRSKPANSISAC